MSLANMEMGSMSRRIRAAEYVMRGGGRVAIRFPTVTQKANQLGFSEAETRLNGQRPKPVPSEITESPPAA